MATPDHQPRRTLLRFERFQPGPDSGAVAILTAFAWDLHATVGVPVRTMPLEIVAGTRPGDFLIAMVNIGAEDAAELRFSDWERADADLTRLLDKYDMACRYQSVIENQIGVLAKRPGDFGQDRAATNRLICRAAILAHIAKCYVRWDQLYDEWEDAQPIAPLLPTPAEVDAGSCQRLEAGTAGESPLRTVTPVTD